MKHKPSLPFSSITAQDAFKLALLLAAVNPKIGGVLVRGPRGSAKSTLVRGLASLLPGDNAEFVTLPLGASEDMLVGTLNLQKALNDQDIVFQPGLLAKAHAGVLYVDEVNLLPDNLVDLLLDVAACGINYVERDGISHSHQADFLLIGTMNPEEGDLRPQLQDRFGLVVDINSQYSLEERIQIVQRRERFDLDPNRFIADYRQAQQILSNNIAKARERVSTVLCSEKIQYEIAKRCNSAAVEGMRADIVWNRAAIAHAAWNARNEVNLEDVDAVESFVLNHRANSNTDQQPPSRKLSDNTQAQNHNKDSSGFNRPELSKIPNGHPGYAESRVENQSNPDKQHGDWGSMRAVHQASMPVENMNIEIEALISAVRCRAPGGQRKGFGSGNKQPGLEKSARCDWFRTLLKNVRVWPPKELLFKRSREAKSTLHVILFDTSGSTLNSKLFARAKTIVMNLAQTFYVNRERFIILGFGNQKVYEIISTRSAPKKIVEIVESLKAGGGTPIREALLYVQRYFLKMDCQMPGFCNCLYIVTDGRTSQRFDDIRLSGNKVVIDVEQSFIKRGRAKELAETIGADYVSITD